MQRTIIVTEERKHFNVIVFVDTTGLSGNPPGKINNIYIKESLMSQNDKKFRPL